jgi:hypothetical protein
MTTQPDPAELRQLLHAWGESDGAPTSRAAMHLLLFTEVPDSRRFARHVEIDHVRTVGGLVRCAWVRDWDKLIGDRELYLSGTEDRFLKIAASFADSRPVSLFTEVANSLGRAHAQRVAEAVLIAADVPELVTVNGTAKHSSR